MDCKYATMNRPNITVDVTLHSSFLSRLIASNFSSMGISLHQFLTWITLGVVDFHFSLVLLRKASAFE
jgi:hypothetical protein